MIDPLFDPEWLIESPVETVLDGLADLIKLLPPDAWASAGMRKQRRHPQQSLREVDAALAGMARHSRKLRAHLKGKPSTARTRGAA